MDTGEFKAAAVAEIDLRGQQLADLSQKIHSSPEVAAQEYRAAEVLTRYLEGDGFSVERGICGLPTAFRASFGRGRPAIAILAEYDALPGIGHACGHNLIAASAVGAGSAIKSIVERAGGSVLVIGTPGEELYGGKIRMAEKGAFDGVDAAMMVHPASENIAHLWTIACQTLDVEFFGKAAHAAAKPEEGINALEALLLSFNGINSLRQHIREKARIHGIITHGGDAANIVPEHTAGNFIVRADENDYLEELKEKVLNCFIAGAKATGARLEYRWADVTYQAMRSNMTMARLFQDNMEKLGRSMDFTNKSGSFSTDMGNVSNVVPGIHPLISIAPPEVLAHSSQFAVAAVSAEGIRGMLDGAKAMAMTAIDLQLKPEILEKARAEFMEGK